jgi:hypothetical protein
MPARRPRQPALETRDVLAFPGDDYASPAISAIGPPRPRPAEAYDHGWPRYLYRDRREAFDVAALRRLCATS